MVPATSLKKKKKKETLDKKKDKSEANFINLLKTSLNRFIQASVHEHGRSSLYSNVSNITETLHRHQK